MRRAYDTPWQSHSNSSLHLSSALIAALLLVSMECSFVLSSLEGEQPVALLPSLDHQKVPQSWQ
jgi:hypothetical protein